jgi:MFS family permease
MSTRRILSLALVLVAIASERGAYYGYRSFMVMVLRESSGGYDGIGTMFTIFAIVSLLGTFVGGAIALGAGPRIAALIGLGASILALSAVALTGAGGALYLAALGNGIARPCAFAYAAETISREGDDAGALAPSPRRFAATACFSSLALAGINVGAFIGPTVSNVITAHLGFRAAALTVVVVMIVAAAFFGGSIFADPLRPLPSNATPQNTAYRTTAPGPSQAAGAITNAPLVALALAVPLGAASFTEMFVDTLQANDGLSAMQRTMGQNFDIGITIIASVGAGVLFFALAQFRSSMSVALFLGIGFIVAGVAAPLALGNVALSFIGTGLNALASPFVLLAIVYAALAVRGKAATLVTAGALAIQTLGAMVAGPLMGKLPAAPMVLLGAVSLVVAGVLIVALKGPIQRGFADKTAAN